MSPFMTKLLSAVVAIAALALVFASNPARAEIEYPWCARYSGFGATNCGFTSRAQCMATVAGVGGICARNPSYSGRMPRVPREAPLNLWSLGIDVQYPWCAVMTGRGGGGGTNCGFVTRGQCMATISGIGGVCFENPAYVSRADSAPPRHHRKKR